MKFSQNWRVAALALAVAGIVGCDPVASSNKDAKASMADGLQKLAKADGYKPRDAVTAAHQSLVAAAGMKEAGPGIQSVTANAVASLDQGVGQSYFSTFFQNVIAARQTLAELRQLSTQVTINTALANGNKKADPSAAQAKIADQIRAMQGGPQVAAWGGNGATLPTLVAIKQESSRLQGVVSDQQNKVADLTKQRNDAIALSETQLKHADSLKGDDAVKAFAEGSDTRRKADDLAIQIDLETDKLNRAQADLAVQQGQEAAVNAGIAQLTAQAKQLDSSWATAQEKAANQAKIATGVVDGETGDKAPASIKALSAKLVSQLADVQSTRTTAVEQFDEAEKYFGTAKDQAQNLIKEYTDKINSPAKDAKNYRALKETMLPQQFALQIGVVRRDSAALIAAEAALLADVAATKTVVSDALTPAGLTVPSELTGIDATSAKTLADTADGKLDDAIKVLTDSVEAGEGSPALKASAKVAHLLTLNARIQLAATRGKLGDTGAKAAADQYLSDARTLRDDIATSGGTVPRLPGELGTAPAAPAPEQAPSTPAAPAPAAPAPAAGA